MDKIVEEVKLQRITSMKMLLEEKEAIVKVARGSTLTKGRRGKPFLTVVNEMRQRFDDPKSYEFARLNEGKKKYFFF